MTISPRCRSSRSRLVKIELRRCPTDEHKKMQGLRNWTWKPIVVFRCCWLSVLKSAVFVAGKAAFVGPVKPLCSATTACTQKVGVPSSTTPFQHACVWVLPSRCYRISSSLICICIRSASCSQKSAICSAPRLPPNCTSPLAMSPSAPSIKRWKHPLFLGSLKC